MPRPRRRLPLGRNRQQPSTVTRLDRRLSNALRRQRVVVAAELMVPEVRHADDGSERQAFRTGLNQLSEILQECSAIGAVNHPVIRRQVDLHLTLDGDGPVFARHHRGP